MLSPISAVASPVGVQNVEIGRADGLVERLPHRPRLEIDIGVDDEARGRQQVGIDDRARDATLGPAQRRNAGGDHDVAAEDEVGAAGRDADGGEIVRLRRDADMAHDRAVLLRQPGEVERRARLAVDMGGHAEQRADGDDAGAADPGDEDVVGAIERRHGRHRQIGEQRGRIGRGAVGLPQLAAMHGDKTRAKALDAGKVLVAVRLVDPPLAAEFGLQRLHRDAVGNGRAIAAAFADALVDEDALRRIRIEPALAAAALLRRAGLVVDQDGEALDLAQLLLHRVEFAAVMNGRA